jgi:hypothetical protein
MTFLFRIISDENQEFFRDLVIDGSDTFLDLHRALQENLGYDPSQLASFFITTENWEKKQEITLIDMTEEPGLETLTMGEVTIGEYITELSQRMIYVFDFFSERAFFMELIEESDQTSPRETPFVANSRGEPPPQVALDLLMEGPGQDLDVPGTDDDTDFLRLEDIDPDLFDIGDTGDPEDF